MMPTFLQNQLSIFVGDFGLRQRAKHWEYDLCEEEGGGMKSSCVHVDALEFNLRILAFDFPLTYSDLTSNDTSAMKYVKRA